MSWDWRHTVLVGVAVAALGSTSVAFFSWVGAHNAWVRAKGTIQAQAQTIDRVKKQAAEVSLVQKTRDEAAAAQLAAMRKKVEQLKTATQVAAWLPKQIPTPEPVKITVPNPTKKSPTPAAVATIPQPDLPALRNYVESCRACSLELHTAQQDLATKDQQLKLAGERLSAVEKERDAALRAAKGGGFWHRAGIAFKWLAIGAGAGAAVLCGSGHCQ
jgi:hypothetical protein